MQSDILFSLPGCQVLEIRQDMRPLKKRYLSALLLLWSIGLLVSFIVFIITCQALRTIYYRASPLQMSHIRMALLFFCISSSVLAGITWWDYKRTPKLQYTLKLSEDAPDSTYSTLKQSFTLERVCGQLWVAIPHSSSGTEV